jgi:hypothetical protein
VPPLWLGRGDLPADARAGDLGVQFGDELAKVGGAGPGRVGLVTQLLGLGP